MASSMPRDVVPVSQPSRGCSLLILFPRPLTHDATSPMSAWEADGWTTKSEEEREQQWQQRQQQQQHRHQHQLM